MESPSATDIDRLEVRTGPARSVVSRSGRSRVLRTATEHYGALLNRPFDYAKYLRMLARSGCTLSRTFVLFRELQSANNPYSTCKPATIDYIAPYPRAGGTALDGLPRFDLDRWNEEFFDRLHGFLALAGRLDVTVELTLLSNVYGPAVWSLSPLHPENNSSGLPAVEWPEFLTLRYPELAARQEALVEKIVRECLPYDNVVFEICNEPGAGSPDIAAVEPTRPEEVNAWLSRLITTARAVDGGRHLIAGQEAFHYQPWEQPLDLSFSGLDYDIVNVHPLPNTTLGGNAYELGRFMSGDLNLAQLKAFCQAAARAGKPVDLDEDNAATQFTNSYGWRIHRKRAWTTVFCGCHYDMIDFTIWPGLEDGTPAAQAELRDWTWTLGRVVDRYDLADAEPWPGVRAPGQDDLVLSAVENEGTFLVYVADARESAPDATPEPIDRAVIDVELPAGDYIVRQLQPATGAERTLTRLSVPGGRTDLTLPAFADDLLVIITRA
ncbi:MAG TPA: hypothetical protein VHC49_06285 [Mycobacteriales bacterium]|nr:hypothetical protein [Mycobacteriales bacterium]